LGVMGKRDYPVAAVVVECYLPTEALLHPKSLADLPPMSLRLESLLVLWAYCLLPL